MFIKVAFSELLHNQSLENMICLGVERRQRSCDPGINVQLGAKLILICRKPFTIFLNYLTVPPVQ